MSFTLAEGEVSGWAAQELLLLLARKFRDASNQQLGGDEKAVGSGSLPHIIKSRMGQLLESMLRDGSGEHDGNGATAAADADAGDASGGNGDRRRVGHRGQLSTAEFCEALAKMLWLPKLAGSSDGDGSAAAREAVRVRTARVGAAKAAVARAAG